ncbi:MAG: cache domain-containing protein [Thermodesulfobacteriota bacterium]|nr:cache domain-containing protein [Thermodesulfobacteriota bacterium]
MIIICEECGKKYRIDPDKIKGREVKFQCNACSHQMIVHKPEDSSNEPEQKDTSISSNTPDSKVEQSIENKQTALPEENKASKKENGAEFRRSTKFRFGLTAKLFTMLIIVSLVPLTMFWGVTFKKTKELIKTGTERHTDQISIGIAKHVDEWLDKNLRVLRILADMDDIISMNRLKQEPLLNAMEKGCPWLYLSFTTDIKGMNVARSDGELLKDYSDRQYYKDIIAGKAVAWEILIGKTSHKPSLGLAVPIKKHNKIVGVLASAMTINNISRQLLTWDGGNTGFAFLVDEKGTVIARQKDKHNIFGRNQLIAAFKNGRRGTVSFANKEGGYVLGNIRGTAFGWGVIIMQEEKEAFYVLDQVLSFAYLLFGITIVFVFIIAWFSGRALSRPILKLTDAADRISVGELEVKIETKRKDEIGDLAEAIARMQDSIRLSIERLRRRRR